MSPTASFKDDLQLDILDNVQVMIAVEEYFAVDIPGNEVNKISTTAHLIVFLAAPSTGQMRFSLLQSEILLTNIVMFLPINVAYTDSL